jgi:uncharacterized protein
VRALLSLILILWSALAFSQGLRFPELNRPVIDQVGLFTPEQSAQLTHFITEIKAQGGPQIGVIIPSDLQGYEIEDYSIRAAEAWKLGGEKSDNGLIIVIAPAERKMRIEVGGGIEGEITDLESSRWISSVLRPAFKNGDYAGGVAQILLEVAGKFNVKISNAPVVRRARRAKGELSPLGTLILMILFFFVFPLLNRSRGARAFGAGAVMGSILGGGRHGGGGGFGGSSGGGWGGGGGGFSGGGASGDW